MEKGIFQDDEYQPTANCCPTVAINQRQQRVGSEPNLRLIFQK
jgi:hypothetical protein